VLSGSRVASADVLTLYSSFGAADRVDRGGILVNGGAPNPRNGVRIGLQGFAASSSYVQLDVFDSISYALSTTEDWSGFPELAVYMALFGDVGGAPARQIAGAYVYWPVTSTPTLFRASTGFPLRIPLSTNSAYWFTLSLRDGFDGSYVPDRTMTWHYAAGTTTPGLRLIGQAVP